MLEPASKSTPKSKDLHKNKSNKFKKKKKKVPDEKRRLIVKNISVKATEMGLLEHFLRCGNVTRVKLFRNKSNEIKGYGYIEFENCKSAAKAIEFYNGKEYLGKSITVEWAIPRPEYNKKGKKHRLKIASHCSSDSSEKTYAQQSQKN